MVCPLAFSLECVRLHPSPRPLEEILDLKVRTRMPFLTPGRGLEGLLVVMTVFSKVV